ncbi:MAG TPA: pro-sigmaK processing inhibitor BofA family protein [Candidatus Micrarchaeota archaeon]|nr:pro-sigmaK processing inhibitor BofA family protein [Candidatus Micrarchaeota archaeon]
MAKQYIEIGTLIVALIALWLLFVFIQNPIALIVNSVIAIVILLLLNMIFKVGIPINILTVLIVAIGGIVGLLLILLFRFSNVAFYSDID